MLLSFGNTVRSGSPRRGFLLIFIATRSLLHPHLEPSKTTPKHPISVPKHYVCCSSEREGKLTQSALPKRANQFIRIVIDGENKSAIRLLSKSMTQIPTQTQIAVYVKHRAF